MSSILKVGIAGYGVVGKKRKKILEKIPGINVIAISDKNPKNRILNKKIKFFNDYKKLFKQNLDILFISLPNKYAADATVNAIKKNINVFCEKPPARNIHELKKVLNEFKKKNKIKLKYGFNHRYHDSIILAKKIIDSGKYGKLVNLKGLYGKSKIISFASGQWRSNKSMAGGGILLDQGIHLLDIMRFFCGEFKEIKSLVNNNYWKYKVEDNAYVIMRSLKNAVAMVHSTATQWQHQFRIEIALKYALLELKGILSGSKSYGRESLNLIPRFPKLNKDSKNRRKFTFKKDKSWKEEIDEFANLIIKNLPVKTGNIKDALKVMSMVKDIYYADKKWR